MYWPWRVFFKSSSSSRHCLLEYKGLSLKEACQVVVLDKLKKMGGEGGLIAVNAAGDYEFCFNSAGMYRAMKSSKGEELIAYYA